MSWDSCPTCPLCAWSSRYHPPENRAAEFAEHVALHSMFEVVVALIAALGVRGPAQPRACSKVGYPDEQQATRALLKAWRNPSPRRREIRSYRCDRCAYWHLTSKPS